MVASLDGRVSCGKCVLGEYFFRYHKSITIKVSWAGQDLACSPETVEDILLLKLFCHCIGGQQFNTLRQSVCLVENQITV